MKKIVLRIIGCIALAMGAVGIMLPLLPTTPFVLLAAGCFAAGSPRLYTWLVRNRHFGPFIENYRHGCGVPKKRKRNAILFLWGTLCISAAVFRKPLVWGILLLVGACVTLHLALIKTAEEPQGKDAQKESNRA